MTLVIGSSSVVRALSSVIYGCLRKTKPVSHTVLYRRITVSSYNNRDARTKEFEQSLTIKSDSIFDDAARKARDKVTFLKAVGAFVRKDPQYRRGHVAFIYSALQRMKEFGCDKDLDAYKQLFEILPPYKMIAKSNFQIEMQHYPKQQQCAIDLMQQMEDNGVIPDNAFGDLILSRFGKDAHASRKYRRLMYWLPKFKNLSPYPIPHELPEDPIKLAILALRRMSVDWENKVTVYKTEEMELVPTEKTFIAYAQSPKQQELISEHPVSKPVYVEGGYSVWLKSHLMTYFVLIADPDPDRFKEVEENDDDLFEFQSIFEEEKPREVIPAPSMHEQEDGTVMATCITGSATKDSLVTWIRYLQKTNPKLARIPVVFRLRSPDTSLQLLDEPSNNKEMVPL